MGFSIIHQPFWETPRCSPMTMETLSMVVLRRQVTEAIFKSWSWTAGDLVPSGNDEQFANWKPWPSRNRGFSH